jgi:hypothetical protein
MSKQNQVEANKDHTRTSQVYMNILPCTHSTSICIMHPMCVYMVILMLDSFVYRTSNRFGFDIYKCKHIYQLYKVTPDKLPGYTHIN